MAQNPTNALPTGGRSLAVFVTLVVLVLEGLAPAASFGAEPVDGAVQQARSLLKAGRAASAVQLLERAVAERPRDAHRHFWLARAYGSVAQDAGVVKMMSLARKARDEFATAVELDPDFLDARLALLEFYLMAPGVMGGGEEKARQQALEIRKRDATAGHHAFAQLAVAKKDFAAARAEYAAAIRLSPTAPLPRYRYGVFLMLNERDYQAAAAQFEGALSLDPKYLPAKFQLGHVAALSGERMKSGERELQLYLASGPGDDDPPLHRAHYWLGMIYEKHGRKADARREFEAALRLQPRQKDVREALKRVS